MESPPTAARYFQAYLKNIFAFCTQSRPIMVSNPSLRRSPRLVGRPCPSIAKALSVYSRSTVQYHSRSIGTINAIRRTSRSRGYPRLSYYVSRTARSRSLSTTSALSTVSKMSSFAFAFDIDGVLLRSSATVPGATKALKYLHDHNIPFILLTNGGGKHEGDRVQELSKRFEVPLTVENFVQSHTPFQEMAHGSDNYEALKDKTVLVTGGDQDQCRKIAEMYGFKNVVTPGDILMAHPKIWPFNLIWTDYYSKIARPLPAPIDPKNPTNSLKIDAVFIFNDPRDWALDSQIILDLLLSKQGILGTYSEKNGDKSLPNNGWQQDGQPALIFSNPDLFWAAAYHMPRLGQGGFRAALEGVWEETTDGAHLEKKVIGKPYPETYSFAERVLQKHRTEILGRSYGGDVSKLDRVFMVGDNPESDIRGANEFNSPNGTEWCSVLVKTGVYRDGSTPKYEPKVIVNDVLAAVKWALEKEDYNHDLETLDLDVAPIDIPPAP